MAPMVQLASLHPDDQPWPSVLGTCLKSASTQWTLASQRPNDKSSKRNKSGFHQIRLQGKGKAHLGGISGCDVVHHNNRIYFNLYMFMNLIRCYYVQFYNFIVFVMLKQHLVFVALSIIHRKPMMATALPEMF